MTDEEIITSYRQAKNKKEQIKILTQLTLYTKEKIVKILQDGGVEVVGKAKYDWGLAKELYGQGKNDAEIANVLGCDNTTVSLWRKNNSLPSKRAKSAADKTAVPGKECADDKNQAYPLPAVSLSDREPDIKSACNIGRRVVNTQPELSDSEDWINMVNWMDRLIIISSTMHKNDSAEVRNAYKNLFRALIDCV